MSREDPTPGEMGFIERRAEYECACLGWMPGQPWPPPPTPAQITFRPRSEFDDPDKWMQAKSNHALATHEAITRRDRYFPPQPIRLPGRPKKDPNSPTARPAHRPRLYALREMIGLSQELVTAIDKEAQPGERRADTIRRLLTMGLIDDAPKEGM